MVSLVPGEPAAAAAAAKNAYTRGGGEGGESSLSGYRGWPQVLTTFLTDPGTGWRGGGGSIVSKTLVWDMMLGTSSPLVSAICHKITSMANQNHIVGSFSFLICHCLNEGFAAWPVRFFVKVLDGTKIPQA